MTLELIILLILNTFIFILPSNTSIFATPRNTFINAGADLGGRIERQLDTGAGFQTKALNDPALGDREKLDWTP